MMPALTDVPRISAKAMLKQDHVRETDLLLLPERVVRLNPSAAAILRLCDGDRTVAELVERLESDFNTVGLTTDVLNFLDDAHARGWVTV